MPSNNTKKNIISMLKRLEFWTILIVIVLVVVNFNRFRKSEEVFDHLLSRSMPSQLLALQLATSMDEQKAALVRYLVEGDSVQKATYKSMEIEIESLVREMIVKSDQAEERKIIQQVDWLLDELDAGGKLVISMDENVDKNYLEISEAIDGVDSLLDYEIVPYVDKLSGVRRERLEEIMGELETEIKEGLLALAENIMHGGNEESRKEFVEARANIQHWENVFIEEANTVQERKWARVINENMDQIILKADKLMINFDRRMEEYRQYSQMEVDADNYIEKNLLAYGNALVTKDMEGIKSEDQIMVILTFIILSVMICIVIIHNNFRNNKLRSLRKMELSYKDSQIKAILQSQEAERHRYAQDLHDSYGQLIAVLKLNLQSVERQSNQVSDELSRAFESSNSLLQNMSDNLRRICFGLMPLTLKERGLVDTLQELAYKINGAGTLKVTISAKDYEHNLAMSEKIVVFRICQEWLNNILKHSNAKNVNISLNNNTGTFNLSIEDDGDGFDKALLFNGSGHGWKNIQSRSQVLGTEIELSTDPEENGTTLHLFRLPQYPVNGIDYSSLNSEHFFNK